MTVEWEIDTAAGMYVYMVDETDDETAETVLGTGDLTVKISKNGGVFASNSPTITKITDGGAGTGAFHLLFSAGTIDTAGAMMIKVTASGANDFIDTSYVVDRSASLYYLHDTTIARTAAAVLTTKRATAIANSYNTLTAAPHDDHREALVGAIAGIAGQWSTSSLTITIADSAGNSVYTRTMAGQVDADAASLATGVDG